MSLLRNLHRAQQAITAVATTVIARPPFHPSTVLCDFGPAGNFTIADAKTGTLITGQTGSGKSSGPARSIAHGFLRAGFGGLVLCAKVEESAIWRRWCKETGREADLVEINASGQYRYNFLEEAARSSDGRGLTQNLAALIAEIAGGMNPSGPTGEGGEGKYWQDSLIHLVTNAIDLMVLSRQPVTLLRLRELVRSAPLSLEQAGSESFRKNSECCKAIVEAVRLAGDDEYARVNVKECASFFLSDWPALSDKTRSITQLMLSMLLRPFLTMPFYKIFSTDTNVRPEDMADGKIIVVDLPMQTYKNAGVFAGILMKYVTQLFIMSRSEPGNGTYLRPIFIYSDEYQNYISDFDYEFVSVSRSAAGCPCFIVQGRETLLAKIANEYSIDSLCSNLVNKLCCQNTGLTPAYMSTIIGERWTDVASMSVSRSGQDIRANAGTSISEEKRAYIEASEFTTLKRGGRVNDYVVEAVLFKGGERFSDGMPFSKVSFQQR